MKFVDVYLEAQAKKNDTSVEKELEKFREQSKQARLRREEAVKLKAVKEIRFGKFITKVPAFNLVRHHDRPLPHSSARTYCRETPIINKEIVERKKSLWLPGQQLHGSMIPRPESVHDRNQELESAQLDRLLFFEAHLAALKAAEASGGGLERIRKRVSMIRRAEEPRASGFELVCSDETLVDESFGDLCIGPYQEEPKEKKDGIRTLGQKLPRMLSLATISEESSERSSKLSASSSMPSTFEGYCDRMLEEEGVEVVAWGHLKAESQDVDESAESQGVDESESREEGESSSKAVPFEDASGAIHMITATKAPHEAGTLSMLYQESDSLFVAFYRP